MNPAALSSICMQPGTSREAGAQRTHQHTVGKAASPAEAEVLPMLPQMKGDTGRTRQSSRRKQEGHDSFPALQRWSDWQLCGRCCSCEWQGRNDHSWALQCSVHSHPLGARPARGYPARLSAAHTAARAEVAWVCQHPFCLRHRCLHQPSQPQPHLPRWAPNH